ncbi:MAG: rhodanese-like domain-containing protein [Cyclobacteriaceae bacterium]|nr:rhodanese-like domain-containing protein [Cyclobacteriaceae bacterium]
MITTIEPQHFKTLKLASDAIVLDVRNRKEQFEEGQISGNVILEMGTQYFHDELEQLDKSKRYLVYCRSGNRSLQVCQQMDYMGFEEVYSLNGGIIKWKEIFG